MFRIVEIEKCSGEASCVMVRGKKKLGYELKIKVRCEGSETHDNDEISIEIEDLCDDGSDPEFTLWASKVKGERESEKTKELKKDCMSAGVLKEFWERCKEALEAIREEV